MNNYITIVGWVPPSFSIELSTKYLSKTNTDKRLEHLFKLISPIRSLRNNPKYNEGQYGEGNGWSYTISNTFRTLLQSDIELLAFAVQQRKILKFITNKYLDAEDKNTIFELLKIE